VPQITFILANDKAADTPDGSGLTWQGWPVCLTVIRVNGGRGSIQVFGRAGA
jgi:hypothetical protein